VHQSVDVSQPAAASLPSPATRRCWVVLRGHDDAHALCDALSAGGWQVVAMLHSFAEARALLAASPAPDVVVTGLRFADGDGMQLMRLLARRAAGVSLFIASREQRAVIKAAVALADALHLRVIGFEEQPAAVANIVEALATWRPLTVPQRRRPLPPLDRDELLELLDHNGLQPWMQPKMRLATREIVGFEALLRAHDAQGAVVFPDRLIGGLTQHGLLDQATMHMARETVAFVADCLGDGLAISASINVSMQSLANLAFCDELERTVVDAGLDPGWITIEITETDAMADLATVIEHTARIRMLGFNLSIDDFGTAYSSFFQLSRIPFSELKIERAFVSGLPANPGQQAIVRACAQLGASLGLHVIAEGVETREELAAVAALGCTEAQGYLVARPMPVAQARAWLGALPDQRLEL
jgi:EAL domain-containing protein (putative c-di-GMP-specific phosphodiesterase class I)